MEDDPLSYIKQVNRLTLNFPARTIFLVFLAGYGLADIALMLEQDQCAHPVYIQLIVGTALSIQFIYSALKKR